MHLSKFYIKNEKKHIKGQPFGVKHLSITVKRGDVFLLSSPSARNSVKIEGYLIITNTIPASGVEIDATNGECEVITDGYIENTIPDAQSDNEESVLKSVFCSYRGVLVVHDVHGNREGHLCGEMTLDKYREIERRSRVDVTEFEGLENYRCIVCELEKKEKEVMDGKVIIGDDGWDNDADPFGKPVKPINLPPPRQQPQGRPKIQYQIPTTAPKNPEIGEFFLDVSTGVPMVWEGTKWVEVSPSSGPAYNGLAKLNKLHSDFNQMINKL